MRISDWSSDVCSSDLAAEELEAFVHHLPLEVGMPELGRRALFGGEFLLHVARQRPVEMRPADLQLRLQIGEDEAAVLEIEDRLAERLALAGVFDRVVAGALRRGMRDRTGQRLNS